MKVLRETNVSQVSGNTEIDKFSNKKPGEFVNTTNVSQYGATGIEMQDMESAKLYANLAEASADKARASELAAVDAKEQAQNAAVTAVENAGIASNAAQQAGSSQLASEAAAVRAEQARDRAITAETNSNNSAEAAADSEDNAKASEILASQYVQAAESAEQSAIEQAGIATQKAAEASVSADDSKYWAGESKKSATASDASAKAAAASAEYAAASEDIAEGHVAAAKAQADIATQKATKAAASELAAENYSIDANTSAANALTSEQRTAQSEVNASTSATQASQSASNAANSATGASVSAVNAKNSENAAAASEAEASSSANSAKASENKAKVSETNAKTSEVNAAASENAAHHSELQSGASAANALASQNAAASSASDSAASAAASLASQNAAKVSEDKAKDSEAKSKASEVASKSSETKTKASEVAALASENAAEQAEANAEAAKDRAVTAETNSQASADDALASQDAAKVSETKSKLSETNAKASETASKASEVNAASSASNAGQNAGEAATSASDALSSQTEAAASAAAALVSQSAAKASETSAAASASSANISEANAKTSETNSATSEANALTSANSATASKDAAKASENSANASSISASASAVSATTSANSASSSASQAASSASNADTSASNASDSAADAAYSAASALASQNSATASATDAETFKVEAGRSASSASASASSASNSASSASSSASNAATSATNASNSASSAASDAANADSSKDAAKVSADAAKVSETKSKTSEVNAASSESGAAGSAQSASISANQASTAAGRAADSASSASTFANASSSFATESEQFSGASKQYAVEARAARDKAEEWAVSDTTSNSAKYWADQARQFATAAIQSGGTFTPTTAKPYPDVSGITIDTLYFVIFEDAAQTFRYTSGALTGQTVASGDTLYYDMPHQDWSIIKSQASASVLTVNGKRGPDVVIGAADVGAVKKTGDTMSGDLHILSPVNTQSQITLEEDDGANRHGMALRYTGHGNNRIQLIGKQSNVENIVFEAGRDGSYMDVQATLQENGQRVYSPNNKPTADELEVVSSADNRYVTKTAMQSNHYCKVVMLLVPASTTIAQERKVCIGRLTGLRGGNNSGNATVDVLLSLHSSYITDDTGHIVYKDDRDGRLVKCNYNGTMYFGWDITTGINAQDNKWLFAGQLEGQDSNFLKPVEYQGDGTSGGVNTVTNQDFKDSIVDLSNSRTKISDGTIDAAYEVREKGERVYSPNNKPSTADLNAVAKTGDTMTGYLTFDSGAGISVKYENITGGWARGMTWKTNGGTTTAGLGTLGSSGGITNTYMGVGPDPWNNGFKVSANNIKFKSYDVYHEGNKPTWSDIGGNSYFTNATISNGTPATKANYGWIAAKQNHGFIPHAPATGSSATGYLGTSSWWFKESWVNSYRGGSLNITGDGTFGGTLRGTTAGAKVGDGDVFFTFINDTASIRYGGVGPASERGLAIYGVGNSLKAKIDNGGQIYAQGGTKKVYHEGNKPTLDSLSGKAVLAEETNRMNVHDKRNTNYKPKDLINNSAEFVFTNQGAVSTDWMSKLVVGGWAPASYNAWELGSNSGSGAHDGRFYVRYGKGESWSEWDMIYTTRRKPSWTDVGGEDYIKGHPGGQLMVSRLFLRASGDATGFLPSTDGTGSSSKSYLGNSANWFREAWVNSYRGGSVNISGTFSSGANVQCKDYLLVKKTVGSKERKLGLEIGSDHPYMSVDVKYRALEFPAHQGINAPYGVFDKGQRVYSPNNKPSLDTLEASRGYDYVATVTRNKWSRIAKFNVKSSAAGYGGSFSITLGKTHGNCVQQETFLCKFHHAGNGGSIMNIGGCGYTPAKVRLVKDNGYNCYFEVFGTLEGTSYTTDQVDVTIYGVSKTLAVTKYTSFTDGTTIPSGWNAVAETVTDEKSISYNGSFLYHTSFKPTASELGVVSKSGDTMTGSLILDNNTTNTEFNTVQGTRKSVYRLSAGGALLGVMVSNNWDSYIRIGASDGTGFQYYKNGTTHLVYHTGNKPTWGDVGGNSYFTNATISNGTPATKANYGWIAAKQNHGFIPHAPATGSSATGYLGTSSWWFKESWVNSYRGGSLNITGDGTFGGTLRGTTAGAKVGDGDVFFTFINDTASIRYGGVGPASERGLAIYGVGNSLKAKIDNGGQIYAQGGTKKVYHEGNKPTLDDITQTYTISQTLTLDKDVWTNVGIAGSDIPTGVYIMRISGMNSSTTSLYDERFAGIISWYAEDTNSSESNEVPLHNSGHANNGRQLYVRTQRQSHGNGGLLLQIKCGEADLASSNYTFTFRKLI